MRTLANSIIAPIYPRIARARLRHNRVKIAKTLSQIDANRTLMATSIYEFAQMPETQAVTVGARGRENARQPGAAPRDGGIYTPRSPRNKGADVDCGGCPQVHIATPEKRDALPLALAEFGEAEIDLLVINGGDGTVRDVLTCGHAIFGDDWPAVAVIPKGKTNALTVDLGVPIEWSLQDAIDAFESGERVVRRPVAVRDLTKSASS